MKLALRGLTVCALGASLLGCTVSIQPGGYTGEVLVTYGDETGPRRFIRGEFRVGCATVVSVRNVNQSPTYDIQFESQYYGGSGSSDIASVVAQLGLVSVGTAAAGMLVSDVVASQVRGTEKEIRLMKVPTNMGWVKAVQLRMDDGSEINLPLLDPIKLSPVAQYKVGSRYTVFYSPTFQNLQVLPVGLKDKYGTLQEEQQQTQMRCKRTLPDDKAVAVLKAHANKVDESKIY